VDEPLDLAEVVLEPTVTGLLAPGFARANRVVAVVHLEAADRLVVAMAEPDDRVAEAIREGSGCDVEIVRATAASLAWALDAYYGEPLDHEGDPEGPR